MAWERMKEAFFYSVVLGIVFIWFGFGSSKSAHLERYGAVDRNLFEEASPDKIPPHTASASKWLWQSEDETISYLLVSVFTAFTWHMIHRSDL
jgi:hypothetical protein